MNERAVTVAEAALHFDVDVSTVRGWIRDGAPCVQPGSAGRGRGALVSIDALAHWRARKVGATASGDRDLMQLVASGLRDAFKRDIEGQRLHRLLEISEPRVAAVLCHAWECIHRQVTGAESRELPREIGDLFSVCVASFQVKPEAPEHVPGRIRDR